MGIRPSKIMKMIRKFGKEALFEDDNKISPDAYVHQPYSTINQKIVQINPYTLSRGGMGRVGKKPAGFAKDNRFTKLEEMKDGDDENDEKENLNHIIVNNKKVYAKMFGHDVRKPPRRIPRMNADFMMKVKLYEVFHDTKTSKKTGGGAFLQKKSESSKALPWLATEYNSAVQPRDVLNRRIIGGGRTGNVRIAKLKYDGLYVAVKTIKKRYLLQGNHLKAAQYERDYWREVSSHPFVCTLFNTMQDNKNVYFISRFCYGGELLEKVKEKRFMRPPQAMFYLTEIILALEYMHEQNIVHRDIRLENILLDEDGHVKITDFGFARRPNSRGQCFTSLGEMEYCMPELLDGRYKKGYNGRAADWYAFGACMFFLIVGHSPFSKTMRDDMGTIYDRMKRNDLMWPLTRYMQNMAKRLIMRLLAFDADNRIMTVKELKNHGFFQAVDWEQVYAQKYPPPFNVKLSSKEGKSDHFKVFADVDGGMTQNEVTNVGLIDGF